MFVRVVRFTDVDPGRMDAMLVRIKESDGPPPDVPATGLEVLHDRDRGTAVVLQQFGSEADMRAGDAAMSAMDAGETPGTRVSVDMCEQKLDMTAPA